MTDGVVLKFSAEEAIKEQERLQKAVEDAVKAMQDEGDAADAAEERIASLQEQLGQVIKGQTAVAGTSLKVATGFGAYGAEAEKAATRSKLLKDGVEKAGISAGTTQKLFQKLLSASGISGAEKAFVAAATGAKALFGAMGPVGIATTAAAAAISLFAINSARAQSESKALTTAAIEQQQKFSTLRDAIDGAAAGFERIAGAQKRFASFESAEKEALRLADVQKALVETQTEFNERVRRTSGSLILNVEEIKKLGEATGQSAQFFRDLEKVAGGKDDAGTRQAMDRLRERIGLQKQDNALVVDAAAVQAALNREAELTGSLIERNNKRLAEEKEQALDDSLVQLAQATKAAARDADPGVGDAEREARVRIRELEKRAVLGLTDAQQALVKTILDDARASDAAKKAREDLAKETRDAEQQAIEDARTKREIDQQRQQSLREQFEAESRYQDVLRQINDETEILLASTDKEIRAKKELAAANDAVEQSGALKGSTREAEIRKAVKAREEARLYEEQLAKVKQIGSETFGTIGKNIANAVENGGSFRQFLQGTIKDLERLALQRIVVDQLANLGSSLFGAAFGPSRPGGYRAMGGVLPGGGAGPQYYAASGMVLNQSTTLMRSGYSVTAAEGGGSAPEAIVPLGRDKYGRLGIIAADGGGGGGGVTFVLPNVRSAEDARQVRPTLRQTMGSLDRARGRWRNGARGAV